jgi:hypothetical protein
MKICLKFNKQRIALGLAVFMLAWVATVRAADSSAKPKVAVFPLGGSVDGDLRKQIGLSLRNKLRHDGSYDPIDGPTMDDLASAADSAVMFDTSAPAVKALAASEEPAVLIWGDLNLTEKKLGHLRLNILDLRQTNGKVRRIERDIENAAAVRGVLEDILNSLPGVSIRRPEEEAVHHDPASDAAWAKNPNLVVNGDFAGEGHWDFTSPKRQYVPKTSDALPGVDEAAIHHGSLAMNLSPGTAVNDGLSCLSDAIVVQPAMRYRIRFQYKSDGPSQMVFVKGYASVKDSSGQILPRAAYQREVPTGGATGGRWAQTECDLSPQNVEFVIQYLKVDLYAYLGSGLIQFRDVQLKEIGPQAAGDQMRDEAIQSPATRQTP